MSKLKEHKSQVLLETVLVFIGAALLLLGAIKLFSGLNQNMLDRYKTYRDSRPQAVNSIVQGLPGSGTNPQDYLEFRAERNGSFLPFPPLGEGPYQAQEERIHQAERKLREMDNIINFVLPYKVNQVKEISDDLEPDYCLTWSHPDYGWGRGECLESVPWGPPDYGAEIQTLCNEMINRSEIAYANVGEAKSLVQKVLDEPTEYGPYYTSLCERDNPSECADPRLPAEDPDDPEFLEKYQLAYDLLAVSVSQNRNMLEQMIPSLESTRESLYTLIYDAAVPTDAYDYYPLPEKGMVGRLRFIRDNILLEDGEPYFYYRSHTNALITLGEMLDFVGGVGEISSPSSFEADFTSEVREVAYDYLGYNPLTRGGIFSPTRANIQDALGIATNWGSADYPTLQAMTERVSASLDSALENWQDQSFRNYQIGFARVDVGALYDVTQISRRGRYPAVEEEE